MKLSQFAVVALILAVTAFAGYYIIGAGRDRPGTDAAHEQKNKTPMPVPQGQVADKTADETRGPHGGRLFTEEDFSIEITIFETDTPPEFRVYIYASDKPLDPAGSKLQIRLERLGAEPEFINFRKENDFLRGDREIIEPHSFTVNIAAEHGGKTYNWSYTQEEGRVHMDEATVKASNIEIMTAGPARIRTALQLSGEIQFNQDRVAHVVPRLEGVVMESAKNLGDEVKQGDLLAVLDSQSLADLKSAHFAAQYRLDLARATYAREKQLWEEKISAEQDYLISREALSEAEIAHRAAEQKLLALGLTHADVMRNSADGLTRYDIRAPIDGVVIEKHLGLGEAVAAYTDIFTIADLSTVWAEMRIYPKDLNRVKLGQQATVRTSALNAESTGRITYVGSLVGAESRSAKALVELENPDRSWRPGLFVTVEVLQDEAEVEVAVPAGSIQTFRDWNVVFGRYGEYFEVRPVELGRSDGHMIEVIQGLAPGTRYAATNSFVLKADLGKAGASHDH